MGEELISDNAMDGLIRELQDSADRNCNEFDQCPYCGEIIEEASADEQK